MLKPSLQLKLGQQLTMTPQLQQAIRLLQLPALELQAHIRELLESNVMLEPVEENDATGTFEALEPQPMPDEKRVDAQAAPESHGRSRVIDDGWSEQSVGLRDPWTATTTSASRNSPTTSGESLQEHLRRPARAGQARAARPRHRPRHRRCHQRRRLPHRFARRDRRHPAARDRRPMPPKSSACSRSCRRSIRRASRARTVGECIELQLRSWIRTRPACSSRWPIADQHLELVADRELSLLRRELRATDEELAPALALVRACHPRPGATVSAPKRRIRRARRVRAPHRTRLGRRDQRRHAAARAPQPELRRA